MPKPVCQTHTWRLLARWYIFRPVLADCLVCDVVGFIQPEELAPDGQLRMEL